MMLRNASFCFTFTVAMLVIDHVIVIENANGRPGPHYPPKWPSRRSSCPSSTRLSFG